MTAEMIRALAEAFADERADAERRLATVTINIRKMREAFPDFTEALAAADVHREQREAAAEAADRARAERRDEG